MSSVQSSDNVPAISLSLGAALALPSIGIPLISSSALVM